MFETFNSLVTLKVFLLVTVSLAGIVSPQRRDKVFKPWLATPGSTVAERRQKECLSPPWAKETDLSETHRHRQRPWRGPEKGRCGRRQDCSRQQPLIWLFAHPNTNNPPSEWWLPDACTECFPSSRECLIVTTLIWNSSSKAVVGLSQLKAQGLCFGRLKGSWQHVQ